MTQPIITAAEPGYVLWEIRHDDFDFENCCTVTRSFPIASWATVEDGEGGFRAFPVTVEGIKRPTNATTDGIARAIQSPYHGCDVYELDDFCRRGAGCPCSPDCGGAGGAVACNATAIPGYAM